MVRVKRLAVLSAACLMAGEYGLTFDPENACIKTLRYWYAKDHIGWGQMFVYVDAVNGDIILEAL